MTLSISINRKLAFIGSFAVALGLGLAIAMLPIHILLLIAICLLLLSSLVIHTPLVGLIILLVLSPLRTLIATETSFALPLGIGQLLLIVYMASWVIYRILHRKPVLIFKNTLLLAIIITMVTLFALNVWNAVSIGSWLSEWLKWLIMAIFVWHISMSEYHNWQWLVWAVLISAVANALVGLYIFFGGSGADHLVIGGRFFRAFGTFGQPNPFGGFMGITLPLSIMGISSQLTRSFHDYRQQRPFSAQSALLLLLFGGVTFVLFAAVIASWSRGAWLGFIIAVSVMVFAIPKRLSISISVAVGLALFIGSLWFTGLIPSSIVNRLTTAATDFITIEDIRGVDITTVNYAVVERIAHWQAAINMAEAHPFAGVGLGNYEVVYDDYRLLNWNEPLGHAHNYYLNILAEAGMIGVLAYCGFWIVIFLVTWQSRQHPDVFARSVVIGLLGSWTYIAVHSIFDNLFVNNLFLHIGLLLSMLAILRQQVRHTITVE